MSRRALGGASVAALLAAATAVAEKDGRGLQVEVWDVLPCPGCGRDVCFLPGQRRNRCGWCKTVVRHAVE